LPSALLHRPVLYLFMILNELQRCWSLESSSEATFVPLVTCTESWACATAPFTLSVSCVVMDSPRSHCPQRRKLPSSPVFYVRCQAPPAWWGLTSAEDCARLKSFMKKLRWHQFLSPSVGSFESMAEASDDRMLRAVVASDAHVLRQFFPPVAKRTYNLRPRKHPFLCLLRIIVILFQEYYLNDNIYIHIYDVTSNNTYKQSFIILYQFNPPIRLLGYTLLTVAFLFLSLPLCYMLRFVSLPNKRRLYIYIIPLASFEAAIGM